MLHRPRTSRSAANIADVEKIIEETPQKSVRQVLGDVTNTSRSSYGSVYRTLGFELKLYPCTLSVMQHLKDSDVMYRLEFAQWAASHPGIFYNVWFSCESHFHLNGSVNSQNCRVWASEKPNFHLETRLHYEKVTVWAALSSTDVIGPFFFESVGSVQTLISDRYLNLLKGKFLPALYRRKIDINNIWFQQDGATPHTAKHVLEWLHSMFGERLISFKTDKIWPPHSPDLSPLDFFLWGYLKHRVCTPKSKTLDDLRAAVRREMRTITQEMCNNVVDNFKKRMNVVIEQNGRHIEHIM